MKIEIHHYYHADEETKRFLRTIDVKLNFLRKEVNEKMGELADTVSALSQEVEAGFTELQTAIENETAQVITLLENHNDVTGAIASLNNMRARFGALVAEKKAAISGVVPDADPLPDAQPPIEAEEPTEETPAAEAPQG